ncbi:unnamed protein product, partial [Symbiodinium pilosum]
DRAAPLLQFLQEMLLHLMRGLRFRLRIVAVQLVRNYADDDGSRTLCAASVARNVATLLQRCVAPCASDSLGLVAQVAELVLRCAAAIRRVEGNVVHGCWVTKNDLAEHLEDCESEQSTVPLPEAAVLGAFSRAVTSLLEVGFVSAPTQGLPKVALELCRSHPVLCLRLREDAQHTSTSEVLFITSAGKPNPLQAPEAVSLPFDAEFFGLLTSEAALRAVTGHLERRTSGTESVFRFESPAIVRQLHSIQRRLRQELEDLLERALSRSLPTEGLLGRLLRCASDLCQAELLEPGPGVLAGQEPATQPKPKRLRLQVVLEDREAADRLKALAHEEGVDILIDASARLDERSVSVQLR